MLYFLLLYGSSLSTWQIFAFVVAYFLALCIAMTLHEFSHAFAATKMGDPTPRLQGRLTLNPFAHMSGIGLICFLIAGFGWAKPVEVNPLRFKKYRAGMAWVSVSGVITNLILAFVFSSLVFFISFDTSNLFMFFLQQFIYYSFAINLALAVFNILPIYPLDGFNFIKSFCKDGNKFVSFMYRYGSFILLIFIASPLFDFIYSYVIFGVEFVFFSFWGLFI